MRIIMRMLLTLYILFVLFIVGVTLACAWGFIDAIHPQYWLKLLYENAVVWWIVSIIGVLVVVLSFMLMFSGIRKRKPKTATISMGDGGAINITLNAIEEMATRHIAADAAVRSVLVRAVPKEGKINIAAQLTVTEGTCIPDVLKALQVSLKAHIETLSGIEVGKITLFVEKTAQLIKARVE